MLLSKWHEVKNTGRVVPDAGALKKTQVWANLAILRTKLANIGQHMANIGQPRPRSGRSSAPRTIARVLFGKCWTTPELARTGGGNFA